METKKLTKFNIFSMVLGSTIGSGIFVMIGFAIGGAGRSLPLAVLAGAIFITLSNAYSYVISSFVPLKGGIYDQVSFVCGPTLVGALALSNILGTTMIGGYAASIIEYVASLIPAVAPYSKLLAIAITLVFFLLSIKGVDVMAKVQNIMSVVLISALALFVVLGLKNVDFAAYVKPEGFFYGGATGFFGAAALMGFACAGGESVGFGLASQAEKPTKNIPIYTLLGVLGAVILYAGIAVVAAGVLPIEDVMYQPLSVVAGAFLSRPLFLYFVIGGAIFALLTSLNGFVAYIRYPMEAAVEDGWLPKWFGKKNKNGYPMRLMLLCIIAGLLPTVLGVSFDMIVTLVSISSLPLYIYANYKTIMLPKKYPELWKKSVFHCPYPIYVVFMIAATFFSVVYMYSYIADYDRTFQIVSIVVTVVIYLLSWTFVKMGRISTASMDETKAQVEAEIAEYQKQIAE